MSGFADAADDDAAAAGENEIHGREEALVHYAKFIGIDAEALHLAGREDESES